MRIVYLSFIALLLSACGGDAGSPEEQIKAVIAQMEEAAEQRNRRGISEHISDGYSDQHGDKEMVNNILRAYLLRNNNINVVTIIHSMKAISPQEYQVELSALMAAKGVDLDSESGRLKADKQSFVVTFVDESAGKGEWRVRTATWKR